MEEHKRGSLVEFQAVILAGGAGNRMFPLTERSAKCLLPVANRPILSFQLEILERSGFADVTVVTVRQLAQQVRKFVKEIYQGKIVVHLVVLDDFCGTADALRHPDVREIIKTDFFVMSSDLITNVFLHYLADIHRSRDGALTVLLKEKKEHSRDKVAVVKKEEGDGEVGQHYIGLDESTSRVVMFRDASDVDDSLRISKAILKRHSNVTVHTALRDAHLYLFSRWVLDLLVERKEISSVQQGLVPFLVRQQFNPSAKKWPFLKTKSGEQERALDMSHAKPHVQMDDPLRVFAVIANDATYCLRANTVASYQQINRDLASGSVYAYTPWTAIASTNSLAEASTANPLAQLGKDCVIGRDVTVGKGSSVKKSSVGMHCKIGSNVKISNSTLMDHVVVEDNCHIDDSVVCHNAKVLSGAKLKNCQIGVAFSVPKGTDAKNEQMSDRNSMVE